MIDRPEASNSLSRATLLTLGRIGRELAQDTRLRAVVITGAGQRVFCAGADLKERQSMSTAEVRQQLELYRTELAWFEELLCPVVAAINGAALGGGLELALRCDFRVAANHAWFAMPETGLGVIPGAGGTQRLPRLVGEARAKELILLGRRLSAAEALAWGLVHRVTPADKDLITDTLEYLRPVLEGAPIALSAARRAIHAARDLSLEAGLALEQALYEECLDSEDRLEALRAFRERRKPVFCGR